MSANESGRNNLETLKVITLNKKVTPQLELLYVGFVVYLWNGMGTSTVIFYCIRFLTFRQYFEI